MSAMNGFAACKAPFLCLEAIAAASKTSSNGRDPLVQGKASEAPEQE